MRKTSLSPHLISIVLLLIAPLPPSKMQDSVGRTVAAFGRVGGDLAATLSHYFAGIKTWH